MGGRAQDTAARSLCPKHALHGPTTPRSRRPSQWAHSLSTTWLPGRAYPTRHLGWVMLVGSWCCCLGWKVTEVQDRVFGGISWNIGVFQVSCFVSISDLEDIEICFGAPMMAKTAYSAFLIASRTLHCVSHGKSDKCRSKRRMPQKWLAGNSIYILHIYIYILHTYIHTYVYIYIYIAYI